MGRINVQFILCLWCINWVQNVSQRLYWRLFNIIIVKLMLANILLQIVRPKRPTSSPPNRQSAHSSSSLKRSSSARSSRTSRSESERRRRTRDSQRRSRSRSRKPQKKRKRKVVVMASLSCGAIFVKYLLCLFNFAFFVSILTFFLIA